MSEASQPSVSFIEEQAIYNYAALTQVNSEPEVVKGYSSLNADNPYVEKYLSAQHAELCANVDKLGKEPNKNTKEKKVKPKVFEVETDLPAKAQPVIFSKSWSKTHDKVIGNAQSGLTLGGPRAPIQISPDWLATLTPQMGSSTIPIADLPGLVWEALGESGRDLYEGTVSLSQFTNREMMHVLRGEPLETVQAAALMSQFVGEEKTRLLLGQDLETVAMVKEMASNFDNLSKEEKFKAGIKLYLSLVTPPLTLAKTANTIPKTAKPLLPAVPLRINPPRAAKNSLAGFTPDSRISKSFTPQYEMVNPTNMPQWQQLARSAEALADAPFAPGSVGAGKVWSIKGRLKAAQLPIEGKIRYVPIEYYKASNRLPKGERNGYLDRFQNEWIKGPSRTLGEPFEWDVQLSSLGKNKLGWASRDGRHLNVSLKGRITHE